MLQLLLQQPALPTRLLLMFPSLLGTSSMRRFVDDFLALPKRLPSLLVETMRPASLCIRSRTVPALRSPLMLLLSALMLLPLGPLVWQLLLQPPALPTRLLRPLLLV